MYQRIKNHFYLLLFFLILVLGFFLRFNKISVNPVGLYVDEAAIGYNAYSILKTGKDEYGQPFPFYFRSFGDYKMPLYIYFTTLPIKLFGLNPFAVRFVSVLAGLSTIIVLFYFVRLIFPEKGSYFALINCFLFAISPWSIFFSRGAFEANLGFFLLILSLYSQLVAMKRQKTLLLILSAILFAISTYSYHTEKYLSPVLFFGLVGAYVIKQPKNIKVYLRSFASLAIFLLLILPHILLFSSAAGQSRINNLSIINKQFSISQLLSSYTAYFSPRNLFFDSDPDKQRSIPDLSVFHPWMVIPFFLGLYLFFKEKINNSKKLLVSILLISPIPASLANDPFSTIRVYPLVLPLIVVISFGFEKILILLKNNILKSLLIFLTLFVSLISLYRSLFVLFPRERFDYWSYGFSQVAEKIKTNPAPQILINDPKGTSYIELLFFLGYSPESYQAKTIGNRPRNYYRDGEWINTFSWDNIQVRSISWKDDIYTYQLIITSPLGISAGQAEEHYLTKAFDIIGPDGVIAFSGYLTNPLLKNSDDKIKLKKQISR